MKTSECLKHFYETKNDEEGRLLTLCGRVEYLTTMRFIKRYLQPGMRVLEIGAGTGRYSCALAERGYQVDAVELLESNLRILRQKIKPDMKLSAMQGNALDLSAFKDNTYDLTLLLGPMYHLFTEEDKLQALSEAIRVTRRGGVIFAAYCMADAAILQAGFLKGRVQEFMDRKMLDPVTFAPHSEPEDIFELHRKADIDRLRSHFPVKQLHYVSADGFANYMRDTLANMDEETYQHYLNYHFATCELPELTGYSNHTIDIFRKR